VPSDQAWEVSRVETTKGGRPPATRATHRAVVLAGIRILVTTVVLGLVFALAPLRLRDGDVALRLVAAVVLLAGVVSLQIWMVARSPYPMVRAVESLSLSLPLLIFVFASTYFAMSQASTGSFNQVLTRTDSVYFTVTVFATVGFGDLVATSEAARVAVTVQMILDLIFIGVVARVLIGTVRLRRAALGKPS
jgi:voltage-gated potassium channel